MCDPFRVGIFWHILPGAARTHVRLPRLSCATPAGSVPFTFRLPLRFEDAAHGAGDAFAGVLAEAAHAFAEFFPAAQDAAARDVLAEALAAAPGRLARALEGAADA